MAALLSGLSALSSYHAQ